MTEIKYTHRTKDGQKARIIATDRASENYPVLALILGEDGEEWVESYTKDLKFLTERVTDNDLVEYSPWQDVAVDTKILVRDFDTNCWVPRYFSHYADGRVHAFAEGRTSWTKRANVPTNSWDQSKLAE